MTKLSLIFNLVFFISCSSVKFKSSDIIPISLEENENHKLDIKERVETSFYLWGLLPSQHIVEVDKEFEKKGHTVASNLEIVEVEKNKKFLWTVLSFGLYIPQTFELVAKSTQ